MGRRKKTSKQSCIREVLAGLPADSPNDAIRAAVAEKFGIQVTAADVSSAKNRAKSGVAVPGSDVGMVTAKRRGRPPGSARSAPAAVPGSSVAAPAPVNSQPSPDDLKKVKAAVPAKGGIGAFADQVESVLTLARDVGGVEKLRAAVQFWRDVESPK